MFDAPLTRAIGLVALGLPATAVAQASSPYRIVVDLRLHDTGGKEVTIDSLGDTVFMDLYVSVFGLDADPTNDGLQSISGGFRSGTGGLGGDLVGLASVAPFNSSGSSVGAQHDLDGDGDLDIGFDPNVDELDPWYRGRSGSPVLVTPPGGFYVGRVRFTATSLAGESTAINFVPRTDFQPEGAPFGGPLYYGASIRIDDVMTTISGDDPAFSLGAPVIIRTGNVVDPGPASYMSGSIDEHVTISSHVRPQPGTTLTFNRGVDVTNTGHFDSRNVHGQFGPHQAFVRDATSGNAGGAFMIANVTVGAAGTGVFSHSGGFTNIGSRLLVGDAAGSPGRVNVSGGNFAATTGDVGGPGSGAIHQTGGAANFVNLRVGAGAGGGVYDFNGGALSVSNTTIIAEGGAGTFEHRSGASDFGRRLAVGGIANATAGTLNVSGGTLTAGSFFDVGNAGAGTVHHTGGAVFSNRLSIGAAAQGRYTIGAGARLDANAILVNSGALVHDGGDVVSATNLFVSAVTGKSATYELHGGSLRSATVHVVYAPTGATPTGLNGLFAQDGGAHVADQVLIRTGGTYRHTGGAFVVKDQLTNTGTLDFGNAPVTFNADRDSFIDLQRGTLAGEGNANFRGATGSLFSFPSGYDPFTQLGSIETEGLIHVAGQPLTIPAGHSVSGSGTIAGTVTNNGALNPGNSPGVLGVDGNYTQTTNGTLRIEIAGADAEVFDQLTVTGSATLGGTLEIALLDDFVPAPEDTFMILSANARSGDFTNATDQVAFNGGVFDVDYGSWYVQLSNFQAIPEPGSLAVFAIAPALMMWRRRRAG